MKPEELKNVLAKHVLWLETSGKEGGKAYLYKADLHRANLAEANLSKASFHRANLAEADLSEADLSGAQLRYANLSKADLSNANLSGAKLENTIGNMREVKSLQLDTHHVTYTADRLQIGCQNHSIEEWKGFGDDTIEAMGPVILLPWWEANKDFIFDVIARYPATPTGHEGKRQ